MALPKKRKKDVNPKVIDPAGGPSRWTNQFLEQNKQFLPRTVDFSDLDSGFIEFINNDLEVIVKDEKVPVHFLTLQRWNEFARTWQTTDKYKNIKIPFISVVRRPNPETGTNPADFKIPVRKNFPYMQIPVWDGNRKGTDIYGIPNPVGVDMIYTVRFFSFKMRELNKLHQKVLQTFASAQAYVNIKGHYFPILLENIGDESQIDNLDSKRYYVQTYEMRLQGYLVDSEEFDVKPSISRIFVSTEVETKSIKPILKQITSGKDDCTLKVIIQFLPGSPTELVYSPENNVTYRSIELENISSYFMYKNGVPITIPFSANENDTIFISITKIDSNLIGEVTLRGLINV